MKRDKISILIPTYNRAAMVCSSIESIIKQTYPNKEIIVYDDGSTDGTFRVLQRYHKQIKVIRSKANKGCAFARNELLSAATGKYACWQDSDDWSNIYRLDYQSQMMLAGKPLVLTRSIRCHGINKSGWNAKPKKVTKSHGRRGIANASAMFDMSKVIEIDTKPSVGGSDAVWIRAMKKKYGRPYVVNRVCYYILEHRNRIGVWKRSPKFNPDWYARMMEYKKGTPAYAEFIKRKRRTAKKPKTKTRSKSRIKVEAQRKLKGIKAGNSSEVRKAIRAAAIKKSRTKAKIRSARVVKVKKGKK